MKEKLIKLLRDAFDVYEERKEKWIIGGKVGERPTIMDTFADHLIANGVTVPVHCKDCKHWLKDVAGCTDFVGRCEWANYMVGAAGYCVYGERKDNEN